MATARQHHADRLTTCPVCLQHYQDPRLLQCAHQFCARCLQKVCASYKDRASITCPTCRAVTTLPSSGGIRNLPRPTLTNDRQDMKQDFTQTTDDGDNTQGLCGKHGGHVTIYCHDCVTSVCVTCVTSDHRGHTVEDIHVAAARARKQITTILQEEDKHSVSSTDLERLHTKVEEVRDQRDTVLTCLDETTALLHTMIDRLETVRSNVVSNTTAGIEAMTEYEASVRRLSTGRQELGGYLVGKASDEEVLSRLSELPSLVSTSSLSDPPTVKVPSVNEGLQNLKLCLETTTKKECVKYTVGKCTAKKKNTKPQEELAEEMGRLDMGTHKQPRFKLELQNRFPFSNGDKVFDLLLNADTGQVLVSTDMDETPIQIYNPYCTKSLSQRVMEHSYKVDHCRYIAMDTRRDRYLAASTKGELIALNYQSRRGEDSKVLCRWPGRYLRGVTYIPRCDLYVVTDSTEYKVSVIDPRTNKIVRSFGSGPSKLWDPSGRLWDPDHLCVSSYSGNPTIVIGDYGNRSVQEYSVNGDHLHTYHGPTKENRLLPGGVVAGPGGRLIVCDTETKTVQMAWMEGRQEQWERICDSRDMGGIPGCVDINMLEQTIVFKVRKQYDYEVQVYSYEYNQ